VKRLSYFQGTEEPKSPQYKPERAIRVQPRFEDPLFRNYDVYETSGKHSPSAGWHSMHRYKSIADFLKAKREKLKGKYKAKDSWIEDKFQPQERRRKIKARLHLLSKLIKTAIDYPIDDQVGSEWILWDNPSESGTGILGNSVYLGGLTDPYLPPSDFEGKRVDHLNFGRDYEGKLESFDEDKLQVLMEKYLNSPEPPTLGLPDGITAPEDKDPEATINAPNPYFGTTDLNIMVYDTDEGEPKRMA
jgi:hypothetical protein